MAYVSGLSYGAYVPSIHMQSLMAQNPRAPRIQHESMKEFNLVAPMVLEAVHIGNLGELPPSPKKIVHKALQLGLLSIGDRCVGIINGSFF